jgi:hypothetical protein
MFGITLNKWQSAFLHGFVTFGAAATTLWLSGHPDIANMTIAGFVAGLWNVLQGVSTSDQSA